MCVCLCVYLCVCVYIYIYIYISTHTEGGGEKESGGVKERESKKQQPIYAHMYTLLNICSLKEYITCNYNFYIWTCLLMYVCMCIMNVCISVCAVLSLSVYPKTAAVNLYYLRIPTLCVNMYIWLIPFKSGPVFTNMNERSRVSIVIVIIAAVPWCDLH